MINRKFVIIVAVILVPIVLFILRFGPGQWNSGSLVVGPKTTVIEGPLLPNGKPDYIAAVNAKLREGVTPDNNAAVPILRATGPKDIPNELRAEFFAGLRIPLLSDGGDYFVAWQDYARALPKEQWPQPPPDSDVDAESYLLHIFEPAIEQPWDREDLPWVARWLDDNKRPLELMVEASTRSRFFAPRVASGKPRMMVSVLLPLSNAARGPAQALAARAMLRLKEEQYQAAWNDLMSLRRLGRVMANEATLVEMLVGYAIEGLGVAGQIEFLAHADLTAEQWAALQREIDALPPRGRVVNTLNWGERLAILDTILGVAEGGAELLSGIGTGNLDNPLTNLALRGVDWNIPLEIANDWMDRLVAVAEIEDPEERAVATARFEADLKAMVGGTVEPWSLAGAVASSRRASEKVGEIIVALMMPAISAVLQAEARVKTNDTLLELGLALAQYNAEHGEYPVKLEQLMPAMLKAIPTDAFAGAPFVYAKRDDGYLLYSLGANRTDDGGRSFDKEGDDLAIEIPRPIPVPAAEANEEVANEPDEPAVKE